MKFTLCMLTCIVKAQHVAKAVNASVKTVKRLTGAAVLYSNSKPKQA